MKMKTVAKVEGVAWLLFGFSLLVWVLVYASYSIVSMFSNTVMFWLLITCKVFAVTALTLQTYVLPRRGDNGDDIAVRCPLFGLVVSNLYPSFRARLHHGFWHCQYSGCDWFGTFRLQSIQEKRNVRRNRCRKLLKNFRQSQNPHSLQFGGFNIFYFAFTFFGFFNSFL